MSALTRYEHPKIDPAQLGFDPKLPFEIALKTAPIADICDAYGLSREDFEELVHDPVFQRAYASALEEVAKHGAGFRMKAGMQAEALLETSWGIIHGDGTPNAVKADLIKATVRWAGLEPQAGGVGVGGTALQINIVMGDVQR